MYLPPPVYIVQQPVYVAPTPVYTYTVPAYTVAAPPPLDSYMYAPPPPNVVAQSPVYSPMRSAVVYRNGMAYQMNIP